MSATVRGRSSKARYGNRNRVTHGMSSSPEWNTWHGMKKRCLYEKHVGYHNYGGRGISVCDRWVDSFENFLADMGEKPEPKRLYSIDRIDPDGNYEPGNCRWATWSEQRQNKRRHSIFRKGLNANE